VTANGDARSPYLRGWIWFCEDYECDCTVPQIVLVFPPYTKSAILGGWSYEAVWEGTFVSGPGEDRSMQSGELAEAARAYGLCPHPEHPDTFVERGGIS